MNAHPTSTDFGALFGVRTLQPADVDRAREILIGACGAESPYRARVLEIFHDAARASTTEHQALVAVDHDVVVGVALFGHVAGSKGAAVLYIVAVATGYERRGVGAALASAVERRLRDGGARVVIAELPDEPASAALRALLTHAGYREEARVPDYYRDHVALLFLRHDLLPRRAA
jgi:ribosomal protein S18 acetylase RimI-like enzyme